VTSRNVRHRPAPARAPLLRCAVEIEPEPAHQPHHDGGVVKDMGDQTSARVCCSRRGECPTPGGPSGPGSRTPGPKSAVNARPRPSWASRRGWWSGRAAALAPKLKAGKGVGMPAFPQPGSEASTATPARGERKKPGVVRVGDQCEEGCQTCPEPGRRAHLAWGARPASRSGPGGRRKRGPGTTSGKRATSPAAPHRHPALRLPTRTIVATCPKTMHNAQHSAEHCAL